ncbi:MAG: VWA domain-containing protein [Polyangiales bacterium]
MFRRLSILAGLLVWGCHTDIQEAPEDPGLVQMEGALGYDLVAAGVGGEVLARLRVIGSSLDSNARPPLNLGLVLDTSGSMRGEPIENLRNATREILGMLRDDDSVSLTTFDTEAKVVLAATRVEDLDASDVDEVIAALEARGTTNLTGGFQQALGQMNTFKTAESIDWLVMLGDGVPNNPNTVLPIATQAAQQQIPVAVLGLGLEFDETLMGQIARQSGGVYEFVEDPERVALVFREQVMRLEQLVARQMVLTLRPGPGVELLEVIGHATPEGGGALQLQVGDLSEGETREYIVRMSAAGRRSGAFVELLDADLRFADALNSAGSLRRSVFLGAEASESESALTASGNGEVLETAERMRAAVQTIEAVRMMRIGQADAARQLMNSEAVQNQAQNSAAYAELAAAVNADVEEDMPSASPDSERTQPAPRPAVSRRAHESAMETLGW